jgi:hypothetical protein
MEPGHDHQIMNGWIYFLFLTSWVSLDEKSMKESPFGRLLPPGFRLPSTFAEKTQYGCPSSLIGREGSNGDDEYAAEIPEENPDRARL